jgi:hypothetical protein
MPEDVINVDLDGIDTVRQFALGAKHVDSQNRIFRYGKYNEGDGAVDAVAGYLGLGLDSAYPDWEITCDYSSTTVPAIANSPKGFAQAAFTDGTFGWWQTKGRNRKAILTDNVITQGLLLMKHATTDGGVDAATGTVKYLGTALEADSGTALAAGTVEIDLE